MKSLIIYSTTDGQTKKISEFIKNNSKSNEFELINIEKTDNLNLKNYDLIILGASIRYGRHSYKVYNFVKKNIKILNEKKNAFFSVNVVARKPEKNTPDTNPYIKKFLKKTTWKPKILAVFAGKVDYPNYNFLNKMIIKFIMYITNGPTNTDQSYEFTNWADIRSFVSQIDSI